MNKHSVNKPWGSFRQFTDNEKTTVKLLFVEPNQELSLQSHKHRKEFWYVISGNPEIIIGDRTVRSSPGDEFSVRVGEKHRISVTNSKIEAVLLEITHGDFDEEDIVRYKDKYGRTS